MLQCIFKKRMKKNKTETVRNKRLVSIIIPTKNSGLFIENCLKSIKKQTYKHIEIIIVDGNSRDNTITVARKYKTKLYQYDPGLPINFFDASYRRNYGATKSSGDFIYYVDTDMELSKNVVKDCVELCEKKHDAVIIPEDSFGVGIWARAKKLQKRCYMGDDEVEAPRFFKRRVWMELGGLDVKMGGGGDDWDLGIRAREAGYKMGRTKKMVMHNEGHLKLLKLFKKRIMYGRDLPKYIKKRSGHSAKIFLFRTAYLKNWRLFLESPVVTFAFVIMRATELTGMIIGMFLYLSQHKDKE